MWPLLARKTQVYVVVTLTVMITLGVQGVWEWWSGEQLNVFKWISSITFIISVALTFLANKSWRWIWKHFPFLQRVFFPDLNGTWIGVLITTWIDPETGKTREPIPATIKIRQSLFEISIKQKTDESTSHSTRVMAEAEPDTDRYRVWYRYDNRPKAEFHYRSTQHEGIAWLELSLEEDPNRLTGQYFTGRRTSGDMDLTRQATT